MRHRLSPAAALAAAALLCPAAAARAQLPRAEYAQHRDALAARLGDAVLVAFGGREPGEDFLSFFQTPRFGYLTGLAEPDAALVMAREGGAVRGTLFVQPREPAREAWTGARLGTTGATERTGLPARPITDFPQVLDSLATALEASGRPLAVVGDFNGGEALSADQVTVQQLVERHPKLRVVDPRQTAGMLDQLRGRKSPAELDLIRRAAGVTVLAQREAIQAVEPGMNEFEIQALIEYTFRRNGADRPSFATIVGSGPNSTTLHYNADDRVMRAGEVLVMDIGASYRGYAADVTRTVPVGGTFSPEQRAIYQLVRDAQAAAERAAKPGAGFGEMSLAADRVLAAGLARLGLIELDAAGRPATFDCDSPQPCSQLSLFYFHGLGHGIGLEVHDPEQFYDTGRLATGSAFTIEPGVYVRADVLDNLPDTPRNSALAARLRPTVARYANIGVRIEDDYVVTAAGVEWISRAPREIEEIEALMRAPYAGPAKRDPALVERYGKTGGDSRSP